MPCEAQRTLQVRCFLGRICGNSITHEQSAALCSKNYPRICTKITFFIIGAT
jgi:hypothetical protein